MILYRDSSLDAYKFDPHLDTTFLQSSDKEIALVIRKRKVIKKEKRQNTNIEYQPCCSKSLVESEYEEQNITHLTAAPLKDEIFP